MLHATFDLGRLTVEVDFQVLPAEPSVGLRERFEFQQVRVKCGEHVVFTDDPYFEEEYEAEIAKACEEAAR